MNITPASESIVLSTCPECGTTIAAPDAESARMYQSFIDWTEANCCGVPLTLHF